MNRTIKSLKTLVKLKQKEIDAIVVIISDLEKKRDLFLLGLNRLNQNRDKEIFAYNENQSLAECSDILSKYLERVKRQEIQLTHRVNDLASMISAERVKLSEYFSELKKFEEVLKNQIASEEKMRQQKENAQLDEFNTTQFFFEQNKK